MAPEERGCSPRPEFPVSESGPKRDISLSLRTQLDPWMSEGPAAIGERDAANTAARAHRDHVSARLAVLHVLRRFQTLLFPRQQQFLVN